MYFEHYVQDPNDRQEYLRQAINNLVNAASGVCLHWALKQKKIEIKSCRAAKLMADCMEQKCLDQTTELLASTNNKTKDDALVALLEDAATEKDKAQTKVGWDCG